MQLPSRPLKPAIPPDEPPPPAAAETFDVIVPKRVVHQPKRPDGHRISRKLRSAIMHVAQGANVCEAARRAGMHRNGLSAALARPHVIALLEQTVRAQLAASAGKAASRLDTLIDAARSEYVQLEASKAVLDRAGYAAQPTTSAYGDVVISISL